MSLWKEWQFAARQLRKSPGFTVLVIATLGLCLGANSAVYSALDAILIRAVPFPQPDRLALVTTIHRAGGSEELDTSQTGGQFEIVRDRATALDTAAYAATSAVNFAAGGRAELVRQQRVSAGFFQVLGTAPLLGREFQRAEDVPGGPALVVVSYDFWQRALAGKTSVIGRTILLRGEPYTVIGVMPPGFSTSCWCGDAPARSAGPADLWTPLRPSRTGEGGGDNYSVIARLRSGVTWAKASAQVQSLSEPMQDFANTERGVTAIETITPFQTGLTTDVRRGLLLTWGAVMAVLLIGCVNVAGLLLARSWSRRREIATRMALGGSRAAVIRQLLWESILLGLGGCAAGLALGVFAVDWLRQLGAESLALWRPIALNTRVFLIMAGISVFASLLSGLAPALAASRFDLRGALADGGRGSSTGVRSLRARHILVIAEIALSMVLLVSAGLLVRTLGYLNALDPGFDSQNVMVSEVSLQDARYQTAESINRLFTTSLARIRQIPGVESAGVALTLPYERPLNNGFRMIDSSDRRPHPVEEVYVTPGYFATMRIPVLQGRAISEADTAQTTPVVVVSESFAKRYYHGDEAVGHHLQSGEIVGVVGDVQQHGGIFGGIGPLSKEPTIYVAAAQLPDRAFRLMHTWFSPKWAIRTVSHAAVKPADVQRTMAGIDPLLPMGSFQTMGDLQRRITRDQRYRATLFSILAGLGLVIAAIGLYGVVTQSVAQRTREFGVRVALGASPPQITTRMLRSGVLLALAGVALGIGGAASAERYLAHFLWGVRPGDAGSLAAATAILLGAAVLASGIPAARVLRLDPAQILREE